MIPPAVPIDVTDPVNAQILAVSEDQIQGFYPDPLGEIARRSGIDRTVVTERIVAMLRAGTIRRVRQTLLATNLAHGALVAWHVPEARLDEAFDWIVRNDPFSGHVVIRSTEAAMPGASYRLWTTLKVPQGYAIERHCDLIVRRTGAQAYHLMPARRMFALGVGHMRRMGLQPGDKSDAPAEAHEPRIVELSELDWRVLVALKREFAPEELTARPWEPRAAEAGVDLETFYRVARQLNDRGVIGRFSTFLEHVKPNAAGARLTRFNALFHWAVPPGRELEAGREVGRFRVMTHVYWRDAGPLFNNVNIMGVAHGTDRQRVLEHKAAIDRHLSAVGIPIRFTCVFWGGRSEIKPSEIEPRAYLDFCRQMGIDPASMRL